MLVLLAGLRAVPRPAAWTVVVGNVAWVLGTGVLAFAAHDHTTLGTVVVLAQAASIAAFADLPRVRLRRSR